MCVENIMQLIELEVEKKVEQKTDALRLVNGHLRVKRYLYWGNWSFLWFIKAD